MAGGLPLQRAERSLHPTVCIRGACQQRHRGVSYDGERLRVDNAHRCLGTQARIGQIALQEFVLHQWRDSHGFAEMTSAKQGLDPHLVVAESNWPSGIFLRDALANRT